MWPKTAFGRQPGRASRSNMAPSSPARPPPAVLPPLLVESTLLPPKLLPEARRDPIDRLPEATTMSWITRTAHPRCSLERSHPWRAIGAWFAFVALAVRDGRSGASPIDHRCRLSDSAIPAAPTPCSTGPGYLHPGRGGSDHRTIRRPRSAAVTSAAQLTDRMTRAPGSGRRRATGLERGPDRGSRDDHPHGRRAGRNGVDANHRVRGRRQPGTGGAGGRGPDHRRGIQRARRRRSAYRRGDFVTRDPPAHAPGLRRLVAAGVPVLLAGTSVAATMGLAAPISYLVPCRADGELDDRADRDGCRRRLLALLPQARARRTRQRGRHDRRRRDRGVPRATRSSSRASL